MGVNYKKSLEQFKYNHRTSRLYKNLKVLKHSIEWNVRYLYYLYKWRRRLIFPYSATIYKNCYFEGANKLGKHTTYNGRMGYGSYIGYNSQIIGDIGRFTSIAPEVINNPGTHPFKAPFVSTSPMFFSLAAQNGHTYADRQCFDEFRSPLKIGNDCWIGQRVFLVGGITIGDGAVILGGAFVTKDIPPYAIVGGVPAKILGYRYDEETISFLLKIKWWENDLDWFEKNWYLLNDIDKLKKHYENKY